MKESKSKPIKFKPRSKYVLIKPDPEDSKESSFGLVRPSNTETTPKSYGVVIAVGQDIKDIKEGDRAVFGTYAGDDISIDSVDYKIVHDDYVLGTL